MGIFQIYNLSWIWSSFLLCLFVYIKYNKSSTDRIRQRYVLDSSNAALYCILFAFAIGFRIGHSYEWVDSFIYEHTYNSIKEGLNTIQAGYQMGQEWLWMSINYLLASLNQPVEILFFVTASGYIGLMYLCIRRLMPYNQWISLLFFISSFSFFTYSCNGIRNGLACSFMLLALSYYVSGNLRGILAGLSISFLAYGIHKTTMLPTLCILAALFLVKNFKIALVWWIFAIFLSLILGQQIQAFFAGLDFDDRIQRYAVDIVKSQADQFSHSGFRWDFLIYSAMPIWLGYYVVIKKKIRNRKYEILLITYTLANSFWVMMNQAAYSNRFAYLSWFMYPLVIAYPLLTIPIWQDQDRKTVRILMYYVGFTLFMNIFYTGL